MQMKVETFKAYENKLPAIQEWESESQHCEKNHAHCNASVEEATLGQSLKSLTHQFSKIQIQWLEYG